MLKELEENELPTNDNVNYEYPGEFSEILYMPNQEEIPESTMSVLIYIADYVGYKVKYNILCENCIKKIVSDKIISYEYSNNVSEYLKLSSRGGLKWPQEFTLLPVIYAYKIFQCLLSEENEDTFLNHGHQKHLLMRLIKYKLSMENISIDVCICGTSSEVLLKKCISVISNILLNN